MDVTYEKRSSWLDRPLLTSLVINWETVLFTTLLILGVISRFYNVGARVMSHDETIHVYHNSWSLYRGQGYRHDPLSHGPFQFHLMALSYFLFGANDFTARLPHVLFSIATIAFMWAYRRYLSRAGALVGAAMMLISPYMLYYGRYARNESLIGFYGVVTLWAILRYLETGKIRYTFFLLAVTSLHFTSKETSFIYAAQMLLFLGLYFVYWVSQKSWPHPEYRNYFLISLMVALLLLGAAAGLGLVNRSAVNALTTETVAPAVPGEGPAHPAAGGMAVLPITLGALAVAALLIALFFLIRGFTWQGLREERSFDLLILLGTMVLPMMAAFPVKMLGLNPIDYNSSQTLTMTGIFLAILILIAVGIGLIWKPRLWLINAAIFYAIFILFYTTVFTNGFGIITGLVGSLGYWLEQQGVKRGSQPWYYYWLIQVPIYEYLPALGSTLALALYTFSRHFREWIQNLTTARQAEATVLDEEQQPDQVQPPVFALLAFWVVTSLIAYTLAGEKMPWLTVHIAWPMILLAALAVGYLIETTDWTVLRERRGWLVLALLPVFLISTLSAFGSLLGTTPPFQGKDLESLRATVTFVTSFVTAVASAIGLYYLVRPWTTAQFYRVMTLFLFAFLGVLTARTAIRAAYINYDNATEYLVYAHAAGGVKEALAQIEEISRRTTDGLAMAVAYDNETAYPFFWYLRNFTDARYYGENPTRSLRDAKVILVSDANFGKIESVVGQAYYRFDYIRLWWPNQDYFGLTWDRVVDAIKDPKLRSAIFQVWLNRDFTEYGQATNQDLSLPNWSPAGRMRLYIRKDVISELWNYGTTPAPEEAVADPYEGKGITLAADRIIGSAGTEAGQLQRPRNFALAADGSFYVSDTGNHRIQHLAPDGSVLQVWGSHADIATGSAPEGTFNEPWGIAVGPDGSVYVADLWNHRIQKFTSDGKFIKMWGYFGQAEQPEAFWGPRDVLVDGQGRVFVTDTGNKRIVIFDADGNYITQFGTAGLDAGQFDEPVGLAMDPEGRLYVADTWNQRIQVFTPDADGNYQPSNAWDVVAWYGQSLDNKPYIAADTSGHIFATDPEGNRVLEFTNSGEFVRFWGDFGTGPEGFDMTGSVVVDPEGGVWVSDVGNGRLMHFTLPAP